MKGCSLRSAKGNSTQKWCPPACRLGPTVIFLEHTAIRKQRGYVIAFVDRLSELNGEVMKACYHGSLWAFVLCNVLSRNGVYTPIGYCDALRGCKEQLG